MECASSPMQKGSNEGREYEGENHIPWTYANVWISFIKSKRENSYLSKKGGNLPRFIAGIYWMFMPLRIGGAS